MGGGGWAPCDTPVVVDDGWVAACTGGELGARVCGEVALAPTPQVALPLRSVAEELTPWIDNSGDESDADIDIGSSPLADRAERRLRASGESAGPDVGSVVLFPADFALLVAGVRLVREGTVPDSVDGVTQSSAMTSEVMAPS